MKSLNRTLSLVLVLAMCLGLMGVASATTFTDAASTQYTEAVSVMTGIGAINGYTDGSFKPAGTITREEAAKMITYAILGPTVASKLSVAATGFSDVAADRWSAPYIAYCVSKGIINGMGDGTFAPTANVTGYQLAKMMLCAAGYGAKGEYTGASWELNVAVDANKYKVFTGAKAVEFSKAATREEAMLYAFNGIQVAQVSYNKLFDQYNNVTTLVDGKEVYVSIMRSVYTKLTQKLALIDGTMGYYWVLNGQTISGFVADVDVLATSTDGTAIADLTTPTNSSYIGYQADAKVYYMLNGTGYATNTTVVEDAAKLRGAVVNFYDEDANGKYNTISVTLNTVDTVTGDVTTKTSGAVTTVTVPGLPITGVDVKNVVGYEGLKKDDVVLYHEHFVSGVKNFVITKAIAFTGTLNAYNVSGTALVVDGKQYKLSKVTDATLIGDYAKYATVPGTTFYTDAAGYVVTAVASKTINTLENTVYVVETGSLSFGTVQARVLKADGKTEIVTVAKTAKFGGTLSPVVGTALNSYAGAGKDDLAIDNGELVANNFYTFTKNTDGTYYLAVAEKNTTSGLAVTKGAPVLGASAVATNGTVFVYYDAVNGTKVYTGIANAPTYTGGTIACITDSNNLATIVVASGGAFSAAAPANTKYVFAYGPATTVKVDANTTYYQYKAVVDGEIKTIDTLTTSALTPSVLQAVTAFDNDKGAEIAPDYTTTLIAKTKTSGGDAQSLTGIKDFKIAGTTLLALGTDAASSGSFVLNKDAKVFRFNGFTAKTPIEEISLSELDNMNGDTYALQAVKTSITDNSLKALFVTVTYAGDSGGVTVNAADYAVTYSGLTVNIPVYYTTAAHDQLDIVAAIRANLSAKGYTVTKVTYGTPADTYVISTTKDSIAFDFAWNASTAAAVEGVKVKVNGTDKLLAATTTLAALDAAADTFIKQTTKAGVISFVAANATTIAALDGYAFETGYYSVTLAAMAGAFADSAQITLGTMVEGTGVTKLVNYYVKATGGTVTVPIAIGTMTTATDITASFGGASNNGTAVLAIANNATADTTMTVSFKTVTGNVTITLTGADHP